MVSLEFILGFRAISVFRTYSGPRLFVCKEALMVKGVGFRARFGFSGFCL